MITRFAAALICSIASAGAQSPASSAPQAPTPQAPAPQAPAPQAPAPQANSTRRQVPSAVHASTAAASSIVDVLGVSTYTISTLYTGDQVRDPFLPPSVGGAPARPRERNTSFAVDIHALELHGIMKDARSDFAIFSTDSGATLILRGNRLYDEHNKRVQGITGSINIKQKRAQLITADKDVQIYNLGESDSKKEDDKESDEPDETGETGSGRSP